jgi:hypothetical protein
MLGFGISGVVNMIMSSEKGKKDLQVLVSHLKMLSWKLAGGAE